MDRIFEAGFWLDLGHRIGGVFGNLFRWVFGTKRRLLTVLFCLGALFVVWSFGKLESQRQAAIAAPEATATATATSKACIKPTAVTAAEKAAANVAARVCESPTYNDPRRNATSRALTITAGNATGTAPEPSVVERFAFNVPNKVEQIGGADAQGITTVLATSSKSKFLLGFAADGTLASVRDITETPDATPTNEATSGTSNGAQSATSSASTSTPKETGKTP